MVRQRSGCGLLAKFFAKKVDDEANQQMLLEAMQAEEAAKNVDSQRSSEVNPMMEDQCGGKCQRACFCRGGWRRCDW